MSGATSKETCCEYMGERASSDLCSYALRLSELHPDGSSLLASASCILWQHTTLTRQQAHLEIEVCQGTKAAAKPMVRDCFMLRLVLICHIHHVSGYAASQTGASQHGWIITSSLYKTGGCTLQMTHDLFFIESSRPSSVHS